MLYHLVPAPLTGPDLMPLNRLRERHPDVYAKHARKYAGRGDLPEDPVPGLDCKWGDVLFLTAVEPATIRELHEEAGLELPPLRWFEIDPTALETDLLQIYWYRYTERHRKFDTDNWVAFEPCLTPLLRLVPEATREHYRGAAQSGRRPFAFFRIPHVLFKGSLELAKLRVIDG